MPAVVIPGRPVPKERPRIGKHGNVYTPQATREYEEAVAWAVRASRQRVEGDCEVSMCLFLRPDAKGDIDNMAKSILDGLVKGGGIKDDSQVTSLLVRIERTDGKEQAALVWDRALPEAA